MNEEREPLFSNPGVKRRRRKSRGLVGGDEEDDVFRLPAYFIACEESVSVFVPKARSVVNRGGFVYG